MSKWISNLLLYEKTGNTGKCPHCGSGDVTLTEHNQGRKSVTFQCSKCGKADHFDGVMSSK